MAVIGQELASPEQGWIRIDDTNTLIKYVGSWVRRSDGGNYSTFNSTWIESYTENNYLELYAKTTKFRFFAYGGSGRSDVSGFDLYIDDELYATYSCVYRTATVVLCCDIPELKDTIHKFKIVVKNRDLITGANTTRVLFDCIDIDENGYITNEDEYKDRDLEDENKTWRYRYTGAEQQFIIPITGTYKLECWGASGGIGHGNKNPFGKGGYACGEREFKKGDVLYIYVGEDGVDTITTPAFNGGGKSWSDGGHNGGRGGGASDIRFKGRELLNRIIVAGGGGGAQPTCGGSNTSAGHGGGLEGLQSYNSGSRYAGACATGGTQTAGGTGNRHRADGSFGYGADSVTCGGGGGGGWYGGGSTYTAGGGGGSSYIDGLNNASTINGGQEMPSIYANTTTIGNTGNGYVKITQLKVVNMQHYYIECDGKKYIPTKQFWNDNLNGFVPIEDFVIKDINNESREFLFDINDLLKPFVVNNKLITPIDIFKNKNFTINKFIGYNKNWEIENKNNLNDNNSTITISYNYTRDLLKECFIKVIDFVKDLDFKKNIYKLKSDCKDIRIALFYNGEYYGNNFKVINKDDIINNGFVFDDLNNIDIPFNNFKIIAVFTGYERLQNIKLYKKVKPISKKINNKHFDIYYDIDKEKVYLIFNSLKISRLIVNKLYKYKDRFGITNSLDDIKE